MTTRSGWCFGPEGAVVHHENCPIEMPIPGSVVRCGCPCHEGESALEIRRFGTATWENVASPQGALTPAGSDHRSILETNGG